MSYQDSAVVAEIRQRLADTYSHARTRGDGPSERKALNRLIRAQRLREARQKGTHTKAEWFALCRRYDWRCVECGGYCRYGPQKDHIVPLFMGGSDGIENLQPLCKPCNTRKGPDTRDWRKYRDRNGFAPDESKWAD